MNEPTTAGRDALGEFSRTLHGDYVGAACASEDTRCPRCQGFAKTILAIKREAIDARVAALQVEKADALRIKRDQRAIISGLVALVRCIGGEPPVSAKELAAAHDAEVAKRAVEEERERLRGVLDAAVAMGLIPKAAVPLFIAPETGLLQPEKPEPSPFRRVVDDLTGGCGCACHTGTGYNTRCKHCAEKPEPGGGS